MTADRLSLVDWKWFVTLTYQGAVPSDPVRRRMLFQYLRLVSPVLQTRFHRLRWAAREEIGEKGGREHWHLLLGGGSDPLDQGIREWGHNRKSQSHVLEWMWRKKCGLSAGIADVRQYDSRLPGVSYILKDQSLAGANAYELSRFRDGGSLRIGPGHSFDLRRKLIVARVVEADLERCSGNHRHREARSGKDAGRDRSGSRRRNGPDRPWRPQVPGS